MVLRMAFTARATTTTTTTAAAILIMAVPVVRRRQQTETAVTTLHRRRVLPFTPCCGQNCWEKTRIPRHCNNNNNNNNNNNSRTHHQQQQQPILVSAFRVPANCINPVYIPTRASHPLSWSPSRWLPSALLLASVCWHQHLQSTNAAYKKSPLKSWMLQHSKTTFTSISSIGPAKTSWQSVSVPVSTYGAPLHPASPNSATWPRPKTWSRPSRGPNAAHTWQSVQTAARSNCGIQYNANRFGPYQDTRHG